MSREVDHSNPITLSRFILAEDEIHTNQDLAVIFSSIELACKVIASSVRRAGLTGLYGLDGSENATGDQVKKLDVLSNDIFVNALRVGWNIIEEGHECVWMLTLLLTLQFSTKIEVMVSEEEVEPIYVQNGTTGSTSQLQ